MRKNSKDAIVDAAITLFNIKGFTGTSIRDIANKANINVANISYYFDNKHGLLEHCFTIFFESYLHEIEKGYSNADLSATIALKEMSKNIIQYQSKNVHLTRFILREISIDSQVIREIMSTYFVKERFFFKEVLEKGMKTGEFRNLSINYTIMQWKALLAMPYLNSQYAREVLQIFPNEEYFADKYTSEINNWIDTVITNPFMEQKLMVVNQ
ncbi:forespore capture DNA-binding protein RefZ [Bacillus massilinigeriensis]|uniref:forespore capture DNA-binding protein RefZ n=1 Tax=Bacillus massilionigeriensis TaxID=1805475 RepID=UPI00096B3F6C|nr:forespore capture DNA-binding protein RefZ [Bacillus massilionigeriensis]